MAKKDLFTIGEVSKMSKIPIPTLRYYDERGILKAEKVDSETGYRYYTWDSIYILSLIRTYKHFDFTLNESHNILNVTDLDSFQMIFQKKLDEYNLKLKQITIDYDCLKSWNDLIIEAQHVWEMAEIPVESLDIPERSMLVCQPKNYNPDSLKNIIVNIDLVNNISGGDVGAFMHAVGSILVNYPDREKRLLHQMDNLTIYIEPHPECVGSWVKFGGFPAIVTYHRGTYDAIKQAYNRVYQWAEENALELAENVIEQYVLDYWSSLNEEQFITKLIFPIRKK
jgi:DNA-binding transcriptional MerR regulator/effector-binding domain-containing protein